MGKNRYPLTRPTKYEKNTLIELKGIIFEYPEIFMYINKSTQIEDTQYATDFVIKLTNRSIEKNKSSLDVAVRVREPGCTKRDLTIRAKTRCNVKTEIDKIKEGYGHIYLYCWRGKNGKIGDYMIINIDRLRSSNLLEKKRGIIPNKDGTGFIAISINELNESNCILKNKIARYEYQNQLKLF